MLPKFTKSKIRPSYQVKGGYTADNPVNRKYKDGMSGFSHQDNFIYFKVVFDPEFNGAFVAEDGTVEVNRKFDVNFNVYGYDGQNIALTIASLVRAHKVAAYLNRLGIYLLTASDTSINTFNEEINAQIWERRDFTLRFNEIVGIDISDTPDQVEIGDSNVIVEVVD